MLPFDTFYYNTLKEKYNIFSEKNYDKKSAKSSGKKTKKFS
jgi:hypothetical protein